MTCDPERVTGFVDGELDAVSAAEIQAHIAHCEACRVQGEAERQLRERLMALPAPPLPAGLEARVRRHLRRQPLLTWARWTLPIAALLLLGLGLRGYAPFVVWELIRDHDHCFGRSPLPAQIASNDPRVIEEWLGSRGTHLAYVPAQVGDLTLAGARFCAQPDLSSAPHLYYTSADRHVSVFLVPRGMFFTDSFSKETARHSVRLLHRSGETLAIVAENHDDALAFERALQPMATAPRS